MRLSKPPTQPMKLAERTEKLRAIRDEVVSLTTSPLYNYRESHGYHAVLGEGNHAAKIMFIGEAPGKNEAIQGRPFCGSAGKILDELLASINLDRKEVYVTNIVKDRPPENRDPLPEEIDAYGPFLDRQIEIIQPAVIATLGRFAMTYIMTKFGLPDALRSISELHGKVFSGQAGYGEVTIIPLYHPAAAIYNQALKETLRSDFQVLKKYI